MSDRPYEAMQAWKVLHGIDSDSAALNRIAELFLLGAVGTLPAQLVAVSADVGHNGPAVNA